MIPVTTQNFMSVSLFPGEKVRNFSVIAFKLFFAFHVSSPQSAFNPRIIRLSIHVSRSLHSSIENIVDKRNNIGNVYFAIIVHVSSCGIDIR